MTRSSKNLRVLAAAALACACIGPGFVPRAQAQQNLPARGAPPPGRLQFVPSAAAVATQHYIGVFVVTLNIAVVSAIPASAPLLCTATFESSDASGGFGYFESATAFATRSGSTATCTIFIPYSWNLGTGGGYTAGYSVEATYNNGLSRSTTFIPITASTFPPNGTTTIKYSVLM